MAGLGLGGDADRAGAAAAELNNDEQWDDAAVVTVSSAAAARKAASATSSTAASGDNAHVAPAASSGVVLDYKSLAPKRGTGSDNIAEKLRLEETKAQLAAAREGMEREAQKLKEEKA